MGRWIRRGVAFPGEAVRRRETAVSHRVNEPGRIAHAVFDHDGTIWLVEHGDHSIFRLDLVNRYTMELIVLEGGEHPLVGHGVPLVRVQIVLAGLARAMMKPVRPPCTGMNSFQGRLSTAGAGMTLSLRPTAS